MMNKYFYYQNEMYATVLLVDFQTKIIQKICNVNPQEVIYDDDFKYLELEEVDIFLLGLNNSYFQMVELNSNPSIEQTPENKAKFYFFEKLNEKYYNPNYKRYIDKEYELADDFRNKMNNYYKIKYQRCDLISKCETKESHLFLNSLGARDDMTMKERTEFLFKVMENPKSRETLNQILRKNENYVLSEKMVEEESKAFGDYFLAYKDFDSHLMKEYNDLFTEDYKRKLDEHCEKGLFLYLLNTPDYPLEDEKITIDDVYNYFMNDNGMYLRCLIFNYVNYKDISPIYAKEAEDLEASFDLLIQKRHAAALRNLYALIEHHHKLCANAFNGYFENEKQFKNGKQRSEQIEKLFTFFKINFYKELWPKIDKAVQEIFTGKGKRFIDRNAIVHGDYENSEIQPTYKDVINVLTLYITLRQMVDNLKNFEEIYINAKIYIASTILNLKK
jgi:hypothetical protein